MAAKIKTVSFQTTVAASGNNAGIVVPEEAIEPRQAGARPCSSASTGTNTGTRSP